MEEFNPYLDIYNRLLRVHKNKQFELDDIIEWSIECQRDYIGVVADLKTYYGFELEVSSNHTAKIPCNLLRLLFVGDPSRNPIYYQRVGRYIELESDYYYDSITIDYYGIPFDPSTNLPYIADGNEQACEAFCVWKMYYEDILTDKISVDAKNRIEKEKMIQIQAAKSLYRKYDMPEMRRWHLINASLIPEDYGKDFIPYKKPKEF